jgi:hypothetical protein
VIPITITGTVPAGLNGVTVDYIISMPGYILEHDQVTPSGNTYQIVFDPATLHESFPNLDLIGRDEWRAGLADTFSIGLLLRGQSGSNTIYQANTITIQGEQVFIGDALPVPPPTCPNPLVGVSIFGLDSGYINIEYTFTAQPDPANATEPITYNWSTDGLVSGQGTTSTIYSWDTSGVFAVSVIAENCDGSASADHTITLSEQPPSCDVAIAGVIIDGPAMGDKGIDHTFTASVTPSSATLPISYTWSTDSLVNGQDAVSATYRWSQPGVYDVAVNAGNCGGSANDTHSIEVGQKYVYLPIVLRNY